MESEPGSLETAVIDGLDFFFSPVPDRFEAGEQPRIDLIQCYDEYVMGYSRSRHYLGGKGPATPSGDTPIHVVLRDGRMIGSWRHLIAGGRCELDVRTDLASDHAGNRSIDEAAAAYGAFLGMAVVRK